MLRDALSFIFIICCYFAIAATTFTTLFAEPDPSEYGSISTSIQTLFMAFAGGAHDYISDPNYALSNSILVMLHLCISNIFLMNFLIAIISNVYNIMTSTGEFEFKTDRY